MFSSTHLRRGIQVILSRYPRLYCRLLRWARRGSTEKHAYLALVRQGDVVFDVGANHGHFTLLFSDLIGRRGEVHAFEPLPPTFARLRETVEQQGRFDNIWLNNVACAAHACELVLHVPGNDGGQASLEPHREGSWRSAAGITSLPVQAICLDDYERGQAASRLEFVKCDVEGAELLVLQGMESKLVRHTPILLVEVYAGWTENFGYGPVDLIEFLETLGYDRFYLASDRLRLMPDAGATLTATARQSSVNVLCASASQHAERLLSLNAN